MQSQPEKYVKQLEEESYEKQVLVKKEVKSEFHEEYQQILEQIKVDLQKIHQKLNHHGITYTPHCPYQKLHLNVEKMVSSFGLYRIHARLAHFTLMITAIRCSKNLTQSLNSVKGSYGKIYFTNIDKKQVCFKSFAYGNETEFQILLRVVVKEWIILKICSVLECSTYMENYLGSDLIIYDDCIQFASEWGSPIRELTNYDIKQLKQQMRLMHELKIIHFDIKPQNIIFSDHYQKPVFIDFGFSEIVEESCGFKTLTLFKGTPNFCSPQILTIMVAEEEYIDLYYNDAYGLNLIIKARKTIKDLAADFQPDFEQSIELDPQNQSRFILLAFQFHYMSRNQIKSRELLNKCLEKDPRIVKEILLFIKSLLNQIFLPNIFYKDLAEFISMPQYENIANKIKLDGEKLYFKMCSQHAQRDKQDFIDVTVDQDALAELDRTEQQYQNYQTYLKLIMQTTQLQNSTILNFGAIIFNCVRFDAKNLEFQDKVMIAKKANHLLLTYLQQEGMTQVQKINNLSIVSNRDDMEQLRLLLRLILQQFFYSRISKWSKDKVFDAFTQLILLDTDYLSDLDDLIAFTSRSFQSQEQVLLVALQLKKLYQSWKMIVTDHHESIPIIQSKLLGLIQLQQSKFQQLALECQNPEIIALHSLYKWIKKLQGKDVQQSLQSYQAQLSIIRCSKIRRYFLYLIVNKCTEFNYESIDKKIRIIEFTKKSMDMRILDFLSYIRISLKLISCAFSHSDLEAFCNYVTTVINCPAVTNKFYINILRKMDCKNHIILSSRLERLIKIYRYQISINQFADYQLMEVIQRIKIQKICMNEDFREKLIQFYQIYESVNNSKKKVSHQRVNHYYSTFYEIQIQLFFYQLSPKTQSVFLKNLEKSRAELKLTDPTSAFSYCSLIFNVLLREGHLLLCENKAEQSMQSIEKLVYFCSQLNLYFMVLELLKYMNSICLKLGIEELVKKFVIWFFMLCKATNNFSFYLLSSSTFTIVALSVFARYHKNLLNQLLIHLAQFLCQHPFQNYFLVLMHVLDDFLQRNPTHIQLLHYSNFVNNQPQALAKNPFFLIFYAYSLKNESTAMQMKLFKIIAIHLKHLSEFAKHRLLQKYFTAYLQFIQSAGKRKKNFIFREAKQYLSYKQCRKYIKNLLRIYKNFRQGNQSKVIKRKLMKYRNIF